MSDINTRISEIVSENDVVLFMKGTPLFPQCGFSSRAVSILDHCGVGYESDDWRVHVWGRNLADEYYAVRGFYFGNEPPNFPATLYTRAGDRRHVGLTIERRFH